jgi:WD40 repeat protein
MIRNLACLALLLLLAHCLAPAPVSAADAPPADGPRPLAKLAGPAGTAVEFSRDGKLILTAGPGGARVWDAASYRPKTQLLRHDNEAPMTLACLSADGARVLTASGPEVRLWDAATGEALLTRRDGEAAIRMACFSPDGSRFVTGSNDGNARVYAAADGAPVRTFGHKGGVYFASFSPDASRLLCLVTDEPGVAPDAGYLWDTARGAVLWRKPLDDPWKHGTPAGFSPDGTHVAFASAGGVAVVDVASGETACVAEPWETDIEGAGRCVAFSPDGSLVASTDNATVRLWNAKNGRLARELDRDRLKSLNGQSVCFSPDGAWLCAAGSFEPWGPCAAVSDARSGDRELEILPERRLRGGFPAIGFSPDGRRVAAGFASDDSTAVWGLPERKRP